MVFRQRFPIFISWHCGNRPDKVSPPSSLHHGDQISSSSIISELEVEDCQIWKGWGYMVALDLEQPLALAFP